MSKVVLGLILIGILMFILTGCEDCGVAYDVYPPRDTAERFTNWMSDSEARTINCVTGEVCMRYYHLNREGGCHYTLDRTDCYVSKETTQEICKYRQSRAEKFGGFRPMIGTDGKLGFGIPVF